MSAKCLLAPTPDVETDPWQVSLVQQAEMIVDEYNVNSSYFELAADTVQPRLATHVTRIAGPVCSRPVSNLDGVGMDSPATHDTGRWPSFTRAYT
jgi:hypothetical protein